MNFNSPACFSSLPVELITEIIKAVDTRTQSSLSIVSKGVNYLSIPILYNDVFLQSFSAVHKCLLTLSSCPTHASYVRMLHIAYNTEKSSEGGGICEHSELLKNTLPLLQNLFCLAINPPKNERDTYEDAIAQCSFPRLDTLIWSASLSLQLLKFFSRHREQIVTLAFNFEPLEPVIIHRYSLHDAEPTPLTGLVKFYGELHHVRVLGAENALRSVTGQWTGQGLNDFESCMINLGRMERLRDLDLMWPVVDIDHLDVISRHVKALQELTISLSSVYVREDEDNDVRIRHALSCLPNLFKLSVRNAGHDEPGSWKYSLDEDYRALKVWGSRCPSLSICITPRRTRWIRCETSDTETTIEWVPTPLVGDAMKWYKRAILNELKPGWKKAVCRTGVDWKDLLQMLGQDFAELLESSEDESESEGEEEQGEETDEVGGDSQVLDVAQSGSSSDGDDTQ
ncbi:hypothetical protein FB446DRAFT_722933 [Lentinula raphanica]|nr:hypothetical protein FB446DRAFT_722933 [Lentinula raphanica]